MLNDWIYKWYPYIICVYCKGAVACIWGNGGGVRLGDEDESRIHFKSQRHFYFIHTSTQTYTHTFLHIRETRAFYLHIALHQVSPKSLVIFFSAAAFLHMGCVVMEVFGVKAFFSGKIYMHFHFSHLTLSLSPHLLSILSFAHRTSPQDILSSFAGARVMMIVMTMK